jgi:hypothetical protein
LCPTGYLPGCRGFPYIENPWARKGLVAHAQGIAAEIPQGRRGRAEELERKARFLALRGLVTILRSKIVARPCVLPKMRPNSKL